MRRSVLRLVDELVGADPRHHRAQATADFGAATEPAKLEEAKARYLGKDGSLTVLLKGLGKLPPEEKKRAGAAINIRLPFMPGLNSDDEEMHKIGEFVSKLKGVTYVSILPYHTVAKGKHERWHMDYKLPDLLPPTANQTEHAAKIIESYGLKTHIGA